MSTADRPVAVKKSEYTLGQISNSFGKSQCTCPKLYQQVAQL